MHTWPAPAKLNLFLHIIGQREDGYHLLQSVIQFIDLCDLLQFRVRADTSSIQCENWCDNSSRRDDLAARAARSLQKTCAVQQGVDIKLQKVIPVGAGLGGGSSNAATTLLALNRLWGCGLQQKELARLGERLGADVPVFMRGAASWIEGVGEQLYAVTLPQPWYVVVYPKVRLHTGQMYTHPDLTRNCAAIRIRDFTPQGTRNVFEPIARRLQPKVERAFQWLGQYSSPRLTGSGSALFATFDTCQRARDALTSCPQEFIAYAVKGLNQSPVRSLCGYN